MEWLITGRLAGAQGAHIDTTAIAVAFFIDRVLFHTLCNELL